MFLNTSCKFRTSSYSLATHVHHICKFRFARAGSCDEQGSPRVGAGAGCVGGHERGDARLAGGGGCQPHGASQVRWDALLVESCLCCAVAMF